MAKRNAAPNEAEPKKKAAPRRASGRAVADTERVVRIITAALILCVAIFVALSPGVVYAPVPRVVLFCLVSFLPAILFGVEAATKFELDLGKFCFVTGGAVAACLGTLVALNYLAKPQEKIAVYHVVDGRGDPVPLDWKGALDVRVTASGLSVTHFVAGNTVILIFPEQVGEAELLIRRLASAPPEKVTVNYAGNRQTTLVLQP